MSSRQTSPRWMVCTLPRPAAALRLFCLPYAGGSNAIYQPWGQKITPRVEVCTVTLPGRGMRISERPIDRLQPLVTAIADGLSADFNKGPYAIFGHSMGALLSFELTRELRRRDEPLPQHLFLSGATPPHLPRQRPPYYQLSDAELTEQLRQLNGTPREVFEHPELLKLMLPVIRADFTVCDTHVYEDDVPLPCPFTVLGGLADSSVPPNTLEHWKELTEGSFSCRMFPGDHFFLHQNEYDLMRILNLGLEEIVARVRR